MYRYIPIYPPSAVLFPCSNYHHRHYKEDVRRSIKLANFCGRGLVAGENRPIKSVNHDTRPILSFASLRLRTIPSSFTNTRQESANRKMILASNEQKNIL